MNYDDNGIFHLTKCLSKCDKYKYSAWPMNGLQNIPVNSYDKRLLPLNTLGIRFYVPSGEYELREQVYSTNALEHWPNKKNNTNYSTWSMTSMISWLMLVVTWGCYLVKVPMAYLQC